MSEYVAELRRLATTCEFGMFLNEALSDRLFFYGQREEAMQRRLLAEPNLDLKRACELAQGMEAANRNAKEIQAKDSGGLVHSIKGRSQRAQLPCTRCLGIGHAPQDCRFRTAKCNKCQKVRHIARACKSKGSFRPQKFGNNRPKPERSQSVHNTTEKSNDPSFTREEPPADIVLVHSVSQSVPESFKVPVEINGTPVTMKLDTGATVSLVSEATWSEQLHRPKLEPCTLKLQSYPD